MKLKRCGAILLSLTLILAAVAGAPASAEAATAIATASSPGKVEYKDEVVYANLGADGSVTGVYVVNVLDVTKPGLIHDYGDYASVTNLTNTGALEQSDQQIGMTASEGKFYYQGNLDGAELPWEFSVTYWLDGVPIQPADLGGKSGHVELRLAVRANARAETTFFGHYLLQISLALDTKTCSNIRLEGGMIANAGASNLITFTTMPGKTGDFAVMFDATDFTLAGIDVAAVPFSQTIELPDTTGISGGMTELSNGVRKLKKGADGLSTGLSAFSQGVTALQSGAQQYKTGVEAVAAQSGQLAQGSKAIGDTLSALSAQLAAVLPPDADPNLLGLSAGLTQLAAEYTGFQQGLDGYTQGVTGLAAGYGQIDTGVAGLATGTAELQSGAGALASGLGQLSSKTSGLPQMVDEEMQRMLAEYDPGEFTPVSFVSEENQNVGSVQFVLKIAGISAPEPPIAETVQPEAVTLWTRFLDLFR